MQELIDSRSSGEDSIPRKSITSVPVTAVICFFDFLIFFSIKRSSPKDIYSSPKQYDFTFYFLALDT